MLSVAVARSYFVLPVLWTTSRFHIMEPMGYNQTTQMFRRVRQVAAPGRRFCLRVRAYYVGAQLRQVREVFSTPQPPLFPILVLGRGRPAY